MAAKNKFREITIVDEKGTFATFFRRVAGEDEYDFDGLAKLRNLLSNEKAKILHVIKSKNPSSMYKLSRIVGRDFKSVSEDVKLLEQFGFIDLISEKTGKRQRLRPVIVVDTIKLEIKL